jgi:hypothetical protein
MGKDEALGKSIVFPKDIQEIRRYIAKMFEESILYTDSTFVYDLVAVLAWRANTKRGRISSRLKGTAAYRFVQALDEAFVRWENGKKRLSPRLRVYLLSALFESASEKAFHCMKHGQLVGLEESIL